MADAIWPEGLPPPLLSSVEEHPPELTVRSEMDTGQAKVRRRATAGVTTFPGTQLKLTRTQTALFDDFFYETLKGGALVFEWKWPRTGEVREFRFLGPPVHKPQQPRNSSQLERYTTSFSLEMLPKVPEGGDGGGEPGNVCMAMFGATGSTIWGTESTLTVQMWAACLGPTAFFNEVTLTRTFVYEDKVLDGSDQLLSVSWKYESPPGTVSRVVFHRDAGWSYAFNAAHTPLPSCGVSLSLIPTSGIEDNGLFVRHKGYPEADNVVAEKWCPQLTSDWMKTVEVTHNPEGCPSNAPRGDGFRAYAAICRIPATGGGYTYETTTTSAELKEWKDHINEE